MDDALGPGAEGGSDANEEDQEQEEEDGEEEEDEEEVEVPLFLKGLGESKMMRDSSKQLRMGSSKEVRDGLDSPTSKEGIKKEYRTL